MIIDYFLINPTWPNLSICPKLKFKEYKECEGWAVWDIMVGLLIFIDWQFFNYSLLQI